MKSLGREMAWMVVPVLVLGGIGFLLRNRKPAVVQAPGPFEPYIKGWKYLPVRPADVTDGYDTRVAVELGAHGTRPPWWNQGSGGGIGRTQGKLVSQSQGKPRALPANVFRWTPQRQYDGRWTSEYFFNRRAVPASAGEVRLQDSIAFYINGKYSAWPLWLDIPVRKASEAVSRPVVSTDPGIVLEGYDLDPLPPGSLWGTPGEDSWRVTLRFRKTGKTSPTQSTSVSGSLRVWDSKGNHAMMYGSQTTGTDSNPRIKSWSSDFYCQNSVPLVPPLYLEGQFEWGYRWPLHVKIPFRDARNRVLLTPRPKPVIRVASITSRAVVPAASENGEDTMVDIQLVPSGKTPLPDDWDDWQVGLSPRVVDAKGQSYFGMPFKGGVKRPMSKMSMAMQGKAVASVQLSYALVLKQIPKSAGKLTFKNEIGAGRSSHLPVSVVVRPEPVTAVRPPVRNPQAKRATTAKLLQITNGSRFVSSHKAS